MCDRVSLWELTWREQEWRIWCWYWWFIKVVQLFNVGCSTLNPEPKVCIRILRRRRAEDQKKMDQSAKSPDPNRTETSCSSFPDLSFWNKTGRCTPCATGRLSPLILGWIYTVEENWGVEGWLSSKSSTAKWSLAGFFHWRWSFHCAIVEKRRDVNIR
jgi:hypothetical protein